MADYVYGYRTDTLDVNWAQIDVSDDVNWKAVHSWMQDQDRGGTYTVRNRWDAGRYRFSLYVSDPDVAFEAKMRWG